MNYTLSEIARICGGTFTGENRRVTEVVTDSRSCGMPAAPLFVAMCGARHDSHDFVDGMYARGVRRFWSNVRSTSATGRGMSSSAMRSTPCNGWPADWRRRFGGTVVGITGSNGKTVVKEWIAQTAPDGVKLFRSPRSYNSQLGAALSLLMIEGDERFALIEAGISQPGEMARLERMISPDVVLFTSLGDAHQEHFASVEEKCAEKLLLALHAPKIIYHSAYEPLASMLREVYAAGHELHDAAAEAGGGLADAASERNSQLVAAFWRVAGEPAPDFGRLQRVAMRLEVKEGINDSLLVDDAYNSDINSLAIALDYLHGVAAGRPTTLILSDILQSGMDDDELYARVAAMVAAAGVGRFVGIGPKLQAQAERFVCDKAFYASTDDYLRRIDRADIAGRAVLLKGNRDSRFEKLEHALSRKSHTTVLEVDLDAMTHNLNYFRSQLRRACGSWRWSRPRATEPAISRLRSCCSIRVSTIWPWRSPTRVCCCASGASRCPSWYSTPMPTVSTRWRPTGSNRRFTACGRSMSSLRRSNVTANSVIRSTSSSIRECIVWASWRRSCLRCSMRSPVAGGRCVWRASSRTSVRRTIPRRTISRGCRSRVSTA